MLRYTCTIILILSQLESCLLQVLPPPVVELSHGGYLVGTYVHTVRRRVIDSFLGIRYAEPPIGSLRFADPVPASTWSDVRYATTKPQPCLQFDTSSPERTPFGSEDCLFLNVFTPRDRSPSDELPVMVWLHQGAYYLGSSEPNLYGPERLLDHDVILVTLNYRLGALGFLSTESSHSPGNYGLKDQLLALKWVRNYISDFGGNPDDVTLFGETIGSACVSFHMVSSASEGLFHKAILQTGNYFDTWSMNVPGEALNFTKRLAGYVSCPQPIGKDYNEMMSCLREAPAEEVVLALNKFFVFPTLDPVTIFRVVVEPSGPNAFLDKDPRKIKHSHGDDMPIIIGATSEGGLGRAAGIIHQFTDEFIENFDTVLPQMLFYDHKSRSAQEQITRRIKEHYFSGGFVWSRRNHHNLTRVFSDRYFFSGMELFLRKRLLTRNKYSAETYVYIFDHNGPTSSSELYGGGPNYYGVSHADELQFLFPYSQLGVKDQKRDRQMQWAMPQLWTDFVRFSNPTPSGTAITQKWRQATSYPFRYVRIGSQFRSRKRSLQIHENLDDNEIIPETDASSFLRPATEPLDLGFAALAQLESIHQIEEIFVLEDDDDPGEGLEYHSKDPLVLISNFTEAESNVAATNLRSNERDCYVYSIREPCTILENKRDRFWEGFHY